MTEIERLLYNGFVSEEFLHEEVRCEYLVPSSMKKAWAIQMDLMVKLFDVCKKHNLRVWAAGGTLLGAVRHKGFIPWDDDCDVFLPREDYDKLLRLPPEEFPHPYFLQSEVSEKNLFTPYARIRNSNTYVNEHNMRHPEKLNWNNGIFVDIFPLDGVGNNLTKLKLQNKLVKLGWILVHAYVLDANPRWIARLAHKILHWPFVPFNSVMAIKAIHSISRITRYDDTSRIGLIMCPTYDLMRNIFSKKDYEETVWLPFETIQIPAPKGWRNVLTTVFGDYMQFPPLDKRGNWHALEFDADTPYKEYQNH